MEDPKALKLFEETRSKTEAGRIHWEPTANESTYIAAIGGEFTLSILEYVATKAFVSAKRVALALKGKDRELLRVTEDVDGVTAEDLLALQRIVKRQALRVDENVDKLLGELSRL